MNINQSKELFDKRNQERWDIRVKKAGDYASLDDIHKNFTQRAKLIDILNLDLSNGSQVALLDAVLKIQRIINLLNTGKEPENESLIDSYNDLQNYIDLSFEQLNLK